MTNHTTLDIQAGIEAAKEDWHEGLLNTTSNLTFPERLTDFAYGYLAEYQRLLGGGE